MYKNFKVKQLQVELRLRGAKVSGKKAELVQRLEAYDRNNNFKNDVDDECEAEPPPFIVPVESSFRDVNADTQIPPVTQAHIDAFLKRYNKNMGRASDMYKDRYLVWIRYSSQFSNQNEHFFKALCMAEFKKSVRYYVHIKMEKDATITSSSCECSVGKDGMAHCKHVVIVLLAASDMSRNGKCVTEKACTDSLQTFHKPKKQYFGTPLKAKDLKRERSNAMSFDPRPVKYQNTGKVNDRVLNFCMVLSNTTMPFKQLTIPANPYGVDNDHDYSNIIGKEKFLESLNLKNVSQEKVDEIERSTRGQGSNKLWHELRKYRITASKFYDVMKVMDSDEKRRCTLANSILNPKTFYSKACEHGIINEDKAVTKFLHERYYQYSTPPEAVNCRECGLFVSCLYPYLGASPDRLLARLSLIEVKCPFSAKDNVIDPVSVPYLYYDEHGLLSLKKTHSYYHQVQGQLFVTGREFCEFVVYTNVDLKVISIPQDKDFIQGMLTKLSTFYEQYLEPAILEKYYYRNYLKYPSFCQKVVM